MIPTPKYRPRPELTHQQALENEIEDQARFLRNPNANILNEGIKRGTGKRWCWAFAVLLALVVVYWIFS